MCNCKPVSVVRRCGLAGAISHRSKGRSGQKVETMKKVLLGVAAVSTIGMANAALDSAVTAAITSAQTDLLALFSALTAAGVAIWVGRLIYRKFAVK